jgi:hypothetical protein
MDLIASTANKTNAVIWDFSPLKVVCNESKGGSGRIHTLSIGLGSWRSMLFSLSILLSSLISMFFRFRQVKHNFGDVPINRQNAANSYAVWTAHCLNREKFENGEKTTRKLYAH